MWQLVRVAPISHIWVLARQLGVSNHFPSTVWGARFCLGQYIQYHIPCPKTASKKKKLYYIDLTPCFHDALSNFRTTVIPRKIFWSEDCDLCPLPVASLSCGCHWSIETSLQECNDEITYTSCTLFQFICLHSHINKLTIQQIDMYSTILYASIWSRHCRNYANKVEV